MIVCLCRRVSDRTIAAAHDAGARTSEDVARVTGAGTACGCCVSSVEALLEARAAACAEPCAACPRRHADAQVRQAAA